MALAKCAWASQSEAKGKDGKQGDQTGFEVKRGNCYNFGQTIVIRLKSAYAVKAKTIGKAAGEMADNDAYGYGQKDRVSSFKVNSGIKWKVGKIEKVTTKSNCDCSELAGMSINFAFKKEIIPSSVYSGNIEALAKGTGKFKSLKYKKGMKLKVGDILVAPGHHVIVVTKDGVAA